MDYTQQEKAHDQLQKLKMILENIDEYISKFQMLGHQANIDLDEVTALRLFARGLPEKLADTCIDLDSPESFERWRNSAQRQHRAWLKKQAIHHNYSKPAIPKLQVSPQGRWQGLGNNWRNRGPQAPCPQLSRRDPNTMDTLAGKATTKEQKVKFCLKGRCFECKKQGHIARNCPTKKTKAHSMKVEEDQQKIVEELTTWSVNDMIARATKFLDEERSAFIQGLQEDEEGTTNDLGFLKA
jgi:hypothetical protein